MFDVRLPPFADALTAELPQENAGIGRFLTVAPPDLYHSAETFARYRSTSMDAIRHAARYARRAPLPDLRELGRRPFPEMQLIMQILPILRHMC